MGNLLFEVGCEELPFFDIDNTVIWLEENFEYNKIIGRKIKEKRLRNKNIKIRLGEIYIIFGRKR